MSSNLKSDGVGLSEKKSSSGVLVQKVAQNEIFQVLRKIRALRFFQIGLVDCFAKSLVSRFSRFLWKMTFRTFLIFSLKLQYHKDLKLAQLTVLGKIWQNDVF